jgi:outer membrane protein TolC
MKMVLITLPVLLFSGQMTNAMAAEKVSWEASVAEATNANTELQAAKSSLQSSQYQVNVARSGFLPSVTANAGYNYDSTGQPKNYSANITATEYLFSGFSDSAKMDRARLNVSSSEANLTSIKAKISFDLKSAYMGLLYAQKYIALTEDIIKRREANVRLVQLRFESGRENIGSLNLSRAYLAQAKFDHLQALNSLDVSQADLARVLGRDDYSTLEVSGEVPMTKPPYESNRQISYKDIIPELPDYKKAYFDEQSAKANIDLTKSSFFPSLNLTQTAGKTGREHNESNDTWSIGASLTFPLFSGGKDYYTYKGAAEDYRASALARKGIEESSVTKLKDIYTKYIEAVSKLEVDNAFSLAASSRERIGTAQYNNGLITFTDWDTIENDLIVRQKTLLQSQRDRVIAEAAWEQVQGKGVIP